MQLRPRRLGIETPRDNETTHSAAQNEVPYSSCRLSGTRSDTSTPESTAIQRCQPDTSGSTASLTQGTCWIAIEHEYLCGLANAGHLSRILPA